MTQVSRLGLEPKLCWSKKHQSFSPVYLTAIAPTIICSIPKCQIVITLISFVFLYQVTIPLLNDSKLIGMSVYNVVILCIVGLAVNLVLGQDPETLFIFNSCISMFCTTLTILIVFLPKVAVFVMSVDYTWLMLRHLHQHRISQHATVSQKCDTCNGWWSVYADLWPLKVFSLTFFLIII